jgi:hypothetical protein
MRKKWFVIAAILLLVGAAGAGVVLYRGNLAHISITVKPPSVNFYTIGISIGELNSLQSFDSGLYSPTGKEMVVSNITIPIATVYVTNLSTEEKSAFYELCVYIKIYNTTATLLEGAINGLDETVLAVDNVSGAYDVAISVYGRTGIPPAVQQVDFDVIIDLDPDIIIADSNTTSIMFTISDFAEIDPNTTRLYCNGADITSIHTNIVKDEDPTTFAKYYVYFNYSFTQGIYNTLIHSCDINGKCVDDRYIFIIPPVPTVLPPELVRV